MGFAQLAQGRAADAGSVQNGLDGTASHGSQLLLRFQQQAGVFHRIIQDAFHTHVFVLAVQRPGERVFFLQSDHRQFAGRLPLPAGAGLDVLQKGQEIGFVGKRLMKGICIGCGCIHCFFAFLFCFLYISKGRVPFGQKKKRE